MGKINPNKETHKIINFSGRIIKITSNTKKDNKTEGQEQFQKLNHTMVLALKFQRDNYFQSKILRPAKLIQMYQSKTENTFRYKLPPESYLPCSLSQEENERLNLEKGSHGIQKAGEQTQKRGKENG